MGGGPAEGAGGSGHYQGLQQGCCIIRQQWQGRARGSGSRQPGARQRALRRACIQVGRLAGSLASHAVQQLAHRAAEQLCFRLWELAEGPAACAGLAQQTTAMASGRETMKQATVGLVLASDKSKSRVLAAEVQRERAGQGPK